MFYNVMESTQIVHNPTNYTTACKHNCNVAFTSVLQVFSLMWRPERTYKGADFYKMAAAIENLVRKSAMVVRSDFILNTD